MNNVFISGFSLDLTSASTLDDWDYVLDKLDDFLMKIKDYNRVQVLADCLEYRLDEESLDDIIFEISDMDEQLSVEMIKEFNQVIAKHKSHLHTETVISSSGVGPIYQGNFISFYIQKKYFPRINQDIQVDSSFDLDELNYNNLGLYPIDEDSFSSRAQLLFDNIKYHSNFSLTLSTVKNGDFKVYSVEFARALKTLNNAFPKLTNNGHNPPDLKIIMTESGIAGRVMSCTVQGRNKSGLCESDFNITIKDKDGRLVTHSLKNLNCEYHLKINFDNRGVKVNPENYNRAYFGLPILEGKKYIALLHLGCHYE
ncbi:TPA: hypothetical protein ACX6QK_000092 [Photobacterium damselae]